MTRVPHRSWWLVAILLALPVVVSAQENEVPLMEHEVLDWPGILPDETFLSGGAVGPVGTYAELRVPEGFFFGKKRATDAVLRETGNLPGSDDAVLVPAGPPSWYVYFLFEDIGYVKDDEEIDADELLEQMKANDGPANEQRRARGLDELTTVGWAVPPHYNRESKNLEWALTLRSVEGDAVNYFMKVLGRRGVTTINLVCNPEDLDAVLPEFRKAVAGFSYTTGNSYAEYKEGDKLAEYGLAGLVAGGGLLAAAKLGWLSKFWKLIAGAVVGIGALFAKLFGGGKKAKQPVRGAQGRNIAQPIEKDEQAGA